MTISDMDLPDAVVEAARKAYSEEIFGTATVRQSIDAALRAALQAMCDGGMARVGSIGVMEQGGKWVANELSPLADEWPALIIRLDADERERKG